MPLELCVNGHLRLAGGKSVYEGRVEICSNGVWGTIWTSGWDSLDAKVVCKELGLYQTYSSMYDIECIVHNHHCLIARVHI